MFGLAGPASATDGIRAALAIAAFVALVGAAIAGLTRPARSAVPANAALSVR